MDGASKADPLELLGEREIANNRVGDVEVVAMTTDDGQGARAYDRAGLTFSNPETMERTLTVGDDLGQRWRVAEDALVLLSDNSQELPRLEGRVTFWFNWFQFNPTTAVFE